jgi:hypothetical protein
LRAKNKKFPGSSKETVMNWGHEAVLVAIWRYTHTFKERTALKLFVKLTYLNTLTLPPQI